MNWISRILNAMVSRVRSERFKFYYRFVSRFYVNRLLSLELDQEVTTEKHGASPGYDIIPSGLHSESVVYSGGIGHDASFGLSLINRYGLKAYGIDPTKQSEKYIHELDLPQEYTFLNVGLADRDGEVEFSTIKESPHYKAGTVLRDGAHAGKNGTIPSKRLKTLMDELGHQYIDILKLDVEGAEYEVLEDMLASDIRPDQIVLEFHPHLLNRNRNKPMEWPTGWYETATMIGKLRKAGYLLSHISERHTELLFVKQKHAC